VRPARGTGGGGFSFGGRVPPAVGGLIALIVAASITGALGGQSGIPLRELGMLVPELVWRGQIWRLATWVFFENDPLGLLFAGLMLYWFGRDLAEAWGPRRFIAVYMGFTVVVAGITCLVAKFLWPTLLSVPFMGTWPVADALIIGWALMFPGRQIMLYFVLPVGTQALIYLTFGGTILYAIFSPFPGLFFPHFTAEILMLFYARGLSFRRLWYRFQIARGERARKKAKHLKVVDRDEPPRYLN
jgi:membrane associated rhomboid family serine protease